MLTEVILIGLSVVATLCLWNSYILSPIKKTIGGWVANTSHPPLIYLFDCDYCKGFWLCLVACIVFSTWYMVLPTYGIVVIALGNRGDVDD